jgi:hypothetical protein
LKKEAVQNTAVINVMGNSFKRKRQNIKKVRKLTADNMHARGPPNFGPCRMKWNL